MYNSSLVNFLKNHSKDAPHLIFGTYLCSIWLAFSIFFFKSSFPFPPTPGYRPIFLGLHTYEEVCKDQANIYVSYSRSKSFIDLVDDIQIFFDFNPTFDQSNQITNPP